ncbi:MAG: hypothetical protein FWF59_10150 [Turicibacter sp.]|nr:hypothetical protein [Turicibacter sp.]
MKIWLAASAFLLMAGCSNIVEESVFEEVGVEELSLEPQQFPIEEELTYIEMLVGMQELQSARQALDNLLFSITGEFDDELTRARINDMITILEEVQIAEEVGASPQFTGPAAVAIAMDRFGVSENFSYFYDENPGFFSPNYLEHGEYTRSGFYVAIKDNALLAAGSDTDAILKLLFVADDGSIVELD